MAVLYDRDQIEAILQRLESGEQLTFEHIGDIFGKAFWIMVVYTLLDARDATRAVDGALRALRMEAAQQAVKVPPKDEAMVELAE